MLAIVGGTGLYELQGLELVREHSTETPFGQASGPVAEGRLHGQSVLFLARHGKGHRHLPHEVNYRANIFALKRAGATQMLGISAVGSLAEEAAPGHFAMPEQYIDFTRGRRIGTFFGDGVAAHISTAKPVSARLVSSVQTAARALGLPFHRGLTYACVEGPRLGTQAESHFMRLAGCHLVGMTNVPEAFLAREAQMGYATIGIVTDYDCWREDPEEHVSVAAVFERYGQSLAKVRSLIDALFQAALPEPEPEIRQSLATALMSDPNSLGAAQREWLSVLQR